jgi:ribosomal protein S27AE
MDGRHAGAMRAKCPKCGAVFDVSLGVSLFHVGPWRLTKCPACGKRSMMNNFVNDPVTWPPDEEKKELPMTEEELKKKRLEESKYEDTQDSA